MIQRSEVADIIDRIEFVRWRDTHIENLQYYYAESEQYVLRKRAGRIWCYAFVNARSPKEAANTFMENMENEMSNKKFDKISYEFTLASGDIDWSDCNFYGEKNGKKTWIGTLATETKIHGSDEWWTYEDIEDFARKAVAADEMYECICDALTDLDMSDGMRRHFEAVVRKARGENEQTY